MMPHPSVFLLLVVGLLCADVHASAGIKISSVDREVGTSDRTPERTIFNATAPSGSWFLYLLSMPIA